MAGLMSEDSIVLGTFVERVRILLHFILKRLIKSVLLTFSFFAQHSSRNRRDHRRESRRIKRRTFVFWKLFHWNTREREMLEESIELIKFYVSLFSFIQHYIWKYSRSINERERDRLSIKEKSLKLVTTFIRKGWRDSFHRRVTEVWQNRQPRKKPIPILIVENSGGEKSGDGFEDGAQT